MIIGNISCNYLDMLAIEVMAAALELAIDRVLEVDPRGKPLPCSFAEKVRNSLYDLIYNTTHAVRLVST